MFIAHIRGSDYMQQSVQTHLDGVALLARRYGDPINLGAHCELSGLLHDLGKYTLAFTSYIKNAVLFHRVANQKIDHSTAGAKYLYDKYYDKNDSIQDFVVETVGMAILSHHSGLQNFVQTDLSKSDYIRRVTNANLPYYEEAVHNFESVEGNVERVDKLMNEAKEEFIAFLKNIKEANIKEPIVYLSYLQKLVFSCLIDADRTDTRCFEEGEVSTGSADNSDIFKKGYHHLMMQINNWKGDDHPITKLRNEMSDSCGSVADEPSSIYTLSIPTGGGKTFASLRYALKHAIRYKKERIIYIVPYTTILEQNAKAVRNIINNQNAVLEHHANVIDDTSLEEEPDFYQKEYHKQLQLGRDNWDYPIIFTTMAQFLDAFFQKGTRKSRRLHHLMNSVIIFDEVQSVPYKHFSLFNTAVNFLHFVGNSSILLCTATQPAVKYMEYEINLKEDAEIVPNLRKTVNAFKRVSIINKVESGGWGMDKLASFAEEIMTENDSLLIILNTKAEVRELYKLLKALKIAKVYHLSTSMCPAHRTEKLDEIREKLGKERIICVSTQLIEAGVDISFETVIRSLAGLDSIAQAAGRCNRNGKQKLGKVYIINSSEENLSNLPEIRIGGEVTRNYILNNPEFNGNYLGPDAMNTYFRYFDSQAKREIKQTPKKLNYKLIQLINGTHPNARSAETKSKGMFKTLEEHFEAIESPTTSIVVPYGKGKEIIASLNQDYHDVKEFNKVAKEAQQFSVNIYDYELQKLSQANLIVPLYNDSIYCLTEKAYDQDFGVTVEGDASLPQYNF
ncbi:CRISPR-associated helicase/endonuclease Cas3 [Compostibacillus humi]|uniref:CRISPR-associated helicase/endonuclease Cas3 n=1 Tax=Compostibacillus humi TaxID=1245525 RepID=A0A8J2XGI3_9BACI|nr:CRISPR-associated helicase Cas3' [Compostibacillus humi]GFZ88614.1 CRISPR-associated helicase/endonuclease Cas3 [Compostibacillus humi]